MPPTVSRSARASSIRRSSSSVTTVLSTRSPISIATSAGPWDSPAVTSVRVTPGSLRRDQALAVGHGDGLRPRVDAELTQDVLDVRPDSLGADDQLARDLGLTPPLGEEPQHLQLPPGKYARDTATRDALDHVLQPHEELVGRERLDEVVVAAQEEAGDPVHRLDALARDEEHADGVAERGAKASAHLPPRDPRQSDVEDERLRLLPGRRGERGLPVRRLANLPAGPLEELDE